MKEFIFVDDDSCKEQKKPLEVFPSITRLTDNESKAYYDIWGLSFEEFTRKYPNIDINEDEFDELYKEMRQGYVDSMESMISASR